MKHSVCLAIVLTMFALPVTAHDTEMLKRELAFNVAIWVGKGKNKPECVLKLDVLNKYSDENIERLLFIFSTEMAFNEVAGLFPEAEVDKLII